jgi:hypothetical protein
MVYAPPPQVIYFRTQAPSPPTPPQITVSAQPAPPTIVFRSSMPPDPNADAPTQTASTQPVSPSRLTYPPASPSSPAIGQVPGVTVSARTPTPSAPEATYEASGLPADFSAATLP